MLSRRSDPEGIGSAVIYSHNKNFRGKQTESLAKTRCMIVARRYMHCYILLIFAHCHVSSIKDQGHLRSFFVQHVVSACAFIIILHVVSSCGDHDKTMMMHVDDLLYRHFISCIMQRLEFNTWGGSRRRSLRLIVSG
jgi:hypothetical protein